jgi:glutathione S-transferase
MLGRGASDPKEIERGTQLVSDCARVLDAALEGNEWIAQNSLTLADLALAAPLGVTERAQLPVTEHRHLQAWFERVKKLDAWQKTEL